MQSARVGADSQIQYPFLSDGDTQTKVYRMGCQQIAEYYNPAQVALDTPMTSAAAAGVIALPFGTDSSAYYVGDENLTPQPGGMIQFDRVFANIPQTRTDPIGSISHTFPGLSGYAGTSGNRIDITSLSMILGTTGIFATTSTAHGLSVGDVVYCEFTYTIGTSNNLYSFYQYAKVLAVPSTTQVRISNDMYYKTQVTLNLQAGYLTLAVSRGRAPYTTTVTASDTSTYILPGVTAGVSSYNDIVTPKPFLPVLTSTGESVSTLANNTSPTRAEYNDMVRDSVNIIIESSVEKWRGNIFRQVVKQVKAI